MTPSQEIPPTSEQAGPERGHRLPGWRWAVAALCLAVVVGAVIFPLVAFPRARADARVAAAIVGGPGAGSDAAETSPKPGATLGATKVRQLPLLSPELRQQVTEVSPAVLEPLIVQRAKALGIDVEALRAAARADLQANPNALANEAKPVPYPYVYEATDRLLASTEGKSSDFVELASLLELDAVARPAEGPNLHEDSGAIAAYALLRRAQTIEPGCDAALSMQHLVSLGQEPRENALAESARVAIEACPKDPTPRWLQAIQVVQGPSNGWTEPVRSTGDFDAARQAFTSLATDFPEDPVGRLGLLDTEMSLGANATGTERRPFLARAAYTRALELAESLGSSPRVLLVRAQALCGLDKCAEASTLLAGNDLVSLTRDEKVLAAAIHAAAGKASEAVKVLDAVVADPTTTTVMFRCHGWTETCPRSSGGRPAIATTVKDASAWGQQGGGDLTDRGYLPTSRRTVWNWQADQVEEARAQAAFVASDSVAPVNGNQGYLLSSWDGVQDTLRAFGQWDRAETACRGWAHAFPEDYRALDRLGEIQALRGNWKEAKESFAAALELAGKYPPETPGEQVGIGYEATSPAWTMLRLGAAQRESGDLTAAEQTFTTLAEESGLDGSPRFMRYHAPLERGQLALQLKQFDEALPWLVRAEEFAQQETKSGIFFDSGAAANAIALANIGKGDGAAALVAAQRAVAHDPESPVFLETLADAERLAGGSAGTATSGPSSSPTASANSSSGPATSTTAGCSQTVAIEGYRKALAKDATLFQSWNNLGVLLAACGADDEAADAFKHSVTANPDYAKGWFNLGSLWSQHRSPSRFLAAEGALGIAGQLDHSLRGEGVALLPDNEAYQGGVDLSKQLPDGWTMGQHARPGRVPLTLLGLLVVAWRVVLDLGKDKAADVVSSRLGGAVRLASRRWARLPGWVGVIASLLAIALVDPGDALGEQVYVVVVGAALIALPLLLIAPRRGHTPIGIVLASVVLGAFGALLPPLPGHPDVEDDPQLRRRSLLAIAVMALVVGGMVVVTLARWVPVGHLTLGVALGTLATLMLPVKPYGGLHLGRTADRVATLVLALLTVVNALGWL